MNRRDAVLALLALGAAGVRFAAPGTAFAQSPARMVRVGLLSLGTPESGVANRNALIEGLAALGWKEGQNLSIESRYANTRAANLPSLAAELVALRPDMIISSGPGPSMALKKLGTDIPVVFVIVADPIGLGLAQSLARPGANFTGLATLAPEFMLAKQVELLREIVSHASRIAFLYNPDNPIHVQGRELRLRIAREQKLEAIEVPAKAREEFAAAFGDAARQKADIMYLGGDPLPMTHRGYVAELAAQHRMPVMFLFHQHVDAGGLVSYGTDQADLNRRAASYVDRILKGAAPSELPIEEPTTYMLVINLKTARALGITIPQSILLRADRVIE